MLARVIAHEHHEKWDGSGYPNALKGEDITIYGRITGLVDVYDALTQKRCYKEAWDFDRAVKYIQDQSAKHFDPKLVELFMKNIDEIKAISTRFIDKT